MFQVDGTNPRIRRKPIQTQVGPALSENETKLTEQSEYETHVQQQILQTLDGLTSSLSKPDINPKKEPALTQFWLDVKTIV